MRTYAQFPLINRIVAGWRLSYRRELRPRFTSDHHTLLDIGTGGGDIARALVTWAAFDGVRLLVTAIDPDERATRYLAALPQNETIDYRRAWSSELVAAGERYDFVISNHVLHHLDDAALAGVFADSERLCRVAAVHSDIARTRIGYPLFSLLTPIAFHRSFIREDGLTSIRRSYRPEELRAIVPPGWRVSAQRPWRTLAVFDATARIGGDLA